MENEWIKYGTMGMAIVGLGFILNICWKFSQRLLKEHKEERDVWRGMIEKQFDEIKERDAKQESLLHDIRRLLDKADRKN